MTENILSGVSTSALGDQTGAKKSNLSVPNTVFAMTVDSIGLVTGEKIRIFSDSGDLPEGLQFDRVYYAIVVSY